MEDIILNDFCENKESKRGRAKKRRWREIEKIKDKQRLRKELEDIDILYIFSNGKIKL